jgi:hypothetical protein
MAVSVFPRLDVILVRENETLWREFSSQKVQHKRCDICWAGAFFKKFYSGDTGYKKTSTRPVETLPTHLSIHS